MQLAWAQSFKKVYHLPLDENFLSFSSASLRSFKTFRQPKLFGMDNLDHGRLRTHGRRLPEQPVTGQRASFFLIVSGGSPISKGHCKNTMLDKNLHQILSGVLYPSLTHKSLNPWNHCRDTYRRLGDKGIRIHFSEVVAKLSPKLEREGIEKFWQRSKSVISCFIDYMVLVHYSVNLSPEEEKKVLLAPRKCVFQSFRHSLGSEKISATGNVGHDKNIFTQLLSFGKSCLDQWVKSKRASSFWTQWADYQISESFRKKIRSD